MTDPWNGRRHKSWASNTVLTLILLIVCLAATVASDYFGEPPTYLVALLGTAAGAFFTALSTDRQKEERSVADTAHRAEAKADAVERRVEEADHRADESERRETGPSKHRDGGDGHE